MLKTFAEIKNSNVLQIAGATAGSDRFKNLLNEATQRLMTRGNWSGVVVPIQVCIRSGCVVFPRYVGSIREAKTCHGSLMIKNQWYDYVERSWYHSLCTLRCESGLVANGRVPTHSTIMGAARKIRAYAQTNADHGKTITIFGTDNGNQPLMHRDENGDWREGIVLTLQPGYAESEGYVSNIHRVLKDRTQKPVTLYAWNVTDSVLEDLALYEPGETNPSFARYQFHATRLMNDDGSEKTRGLTCLVKLNFIPVEFDTDLVLIDNIAALKMMVAAILLEEGGDDQGAQAKITKAIQELNMQLRDDNFLNQVSVSANSVGTMILSPI